MDDDEPPCGCWRLNLQEQQVLTMAEPSLQPYPSCFLTQGLSLILESDRKPQVFLRLCLLSAGVTGLCHCLVFTWVLGNLNLGSCVCGGSSSHNELSLRLCYKMFSSALVVCLLDANIPLTPQSLPNQKCPGTAECHCGGNSTAAGTQHSLCT